MPGMIDANRPPRDSSATADTQPSEDGSATAMLDQIEKNVEMKIQKERPEIEEDYRSTKVAGLQMMFSERTHELMVKHFAKFIKGPEDIPKVVAQSTVKLMSMLFEGSKGSMSINSLGPAAIVFMAHGLKYVDGTLFPVTKDIIDATTHALATGLFALTNVSPEKIQGAIENAAKQPAASAEEPATPVASAEEV